MDESASVALIRALASVWSAIRSQHPQVPDVVVLAAPAPRGMGNVLGYFAPLRWQQRSLSSGFIHEVVVVAEHLRRTAEEIAETLLHEAAHALSAERGVKDCSASQYHNRHFRNAALELGLDCQMVPNYGWAYTTLPEETRRLYAAEIAALDAVLLHRRGAARPSHAPPATPTAASDSDESPATKSRSRKAVCTCSPPFIIRVAKSTLDATTILCATCGEAFRFAP